MARSKEIQRAARKLSYALRKFKEQGGIIARSTWGIVEGDVACAMGALIAVYDDVDDQPDLAKASAQILGLTGQKSRKVLAFIDGFDGNPFPKRSKLYQWYLLGQKLAEKFGATSVSY